MNLAYDIGIFLWTTSFSLMLFGTWLSYKHFKKVPPHLDAPFNLISISILKPLKGIDEGAKENLESFFKLDYPKFELLFSVQSALDPVIPIVEKLIKKYPKVVAELIVGNIQVGLNPKVNNLMTSYTKAQHDWILISDSNVRIQTNYLKRMAAHIETGVGIVTAIVAGIEPQKIGGLLESTFMNTFYPRGVFLAHWLGRPLVLGKSMLFKRSLANRFGGIKILGQYLAEDYMAGQAFQYLGYRSILMSDSVKQFIGSYSFRTFWLRHIRWGRIRKAQAPLIFFMEPLFNSLLCGIIGTIVFQTNGLFFLCHLATWFLCDLFIMTKLNPQISFFTPIIWLVREFLALPLWFHTVIGNKIFWRGQNYILEPGGLLKVKET